MSISPEHFSEAPISQDESISLELEAAKRLVNFELENKVSLGIVFGGAEIVEEIIFTGDLSMMSDEIKKKFRIDVSKILDQSVEGRRHPTILERLSGLEKIEQEHKNHRV